ncbi:MAG: HNH endonuclease [Coriobacteriales bacterium]
MASSDPLRTCTKCGETFPATTEYFYPHKYGKYGLKSQCKVCSRASAAAYAKAHAEARAARRAAAYAADPERFRAYCRSWHATHRDHIARHRAENRDHVLMLQREYNATHRAERHRYYVANREAILAAAAAHYAENRERICARQREWSKDNPGASRAAHRNRAARKMGSGGTHTTADVRAQYKRQRGRCYWCGEKTAADYHVDHVIPLALGGSNGPENLVIACPSCNLHKGAKHPIDFCGRLL